MAAAQTGISCGRRGAITERQRGEEGLRGACLFGNLDSTAPSPNRSDRKFEALQKLSDESYRQSAESPQEWRTEAVLETPAKADPTTRQGEAVAAQDAPGDRPSE